MHCPSDNACGRGIFPCNPFTSREVAVFHLSVKVVSRVKGRSATAAAAYRAAALVKDDRTGIEHDYTRKRDVLGSQIILPVGAPDWARDRSKLWSAAETAERRRDATVAREWEIAFPTALTADMRKALAAEYGGWLSRRYSIPIDLTLHAPSRKGDRRNFHAHLLGSTRALGRDGFGAKTRQLDDGRGYGEVVRCREEWARLCNRELAKIGAPLVSAKSLAAQREDALAEAERYEKAAARLESWRHDDIHAARSAAAKARKEAEALDREPTIHVGPAGTEMSRSGRHSHRAAENQAIQARNEARRRAQPVQSAPKAVAPAAPVRPAAGPATPALSIVAKPAVPAKPVPQATPAKPAASVPAAPLRPAPTPAVTPVVPAPAVKQAAQAPASAPSRPAAAAKAEERRPEAAPLKAERPPASAPVQPPTPAAAPAVAGPGPGPSAEAEIRQLSKRARPGAIFLGAALQRASKVLPLDQLNAEARTISQLFRTDGDGAGARLIELVMDAVNGISASLPALRFDPASVDMASLMRRLAKATPLIARFVVDRGDEGGHGGRGENGRGG